MVARFFELCDNARFFGFLYFFVFSRDKRARRFVIISEPGKPEIKDKGEKEKMKKAFCAFLFAVVLLSAVSCADTGRARTTIVGRNVREVKTLHSYELERNGETNFLYNRLIITFTNDETLKFRKKDEHRVYRKLRPGDIDQLGLPYNLMNEQLAALENDPDNEELKNELAQYHLVWIFYLQTNTRPELIKKMKELEWDSQILDVSVDYIYD